MKETAIVILSICCITGLAALALLQHINGAVLSTSVTVIGGLGGYMVGKRKGKPMPTPKVLPQPHNDAAD